MTSSDNDLEMAVGVGWKVVGVTGGVEFVFEGTRSQQLTDR